MFQSAVIRDEFTFSGHNAALTAVCYNRHQDCFVSADDSSLRLWRPQRSQESSQQAQLRTISLPPRTNSFIQALEYVSSRQLYVASALNGTLKTFDSGLNELGAVFTGRATILSMAFDSKRSRLLTGGADGCGAWQVRGKQVPLGGNATTASDAAVNPHYELSPLPHFFHGSPQESAASTTSSVRTGKRTRGRGEGDTMNPSDPGNDKWVRSVLLNVEASRLYAQSAQHIDVFAAADGSFVERHTDLFPEEYGALSAFALHERSQYLICGTSSGAIFVLSQRPTAVVHAFKDHTAGISSLAVLESSGLVLSSSLDGTVRIWDLEARRQVHRLDLGQPVQALHLLPGSNTLAAGPSHQSLRFYCRIRSIVRIFRIQSTIKEHMACLAPISILTRIPIPRSDRPEAREKTIKESTIPSPLRSKPAPTNGRQTKKNVLKTSVSSTNHRPIPTQRPRIRIQGSESDEEESESSDSDYTDSDSDLDGDGDADQTSAAARQLILAAGTDRTIRIFAGRAANEAPSFTWIPEEDALDLIAFALHPVARRLFLLLDSQRLLIVDATTPANADSTDTKRSTIERVVNFGGLPLLSLPKLSNGSPSTITNATSPAGAEASDGRRPSVFRSPNFQAQLSPSNAKRPSSVVSPRSASIRGQHRRKDTLLPSSPAPSNSASGGLSYHQRSGSTSTAASLRGSLRCICVCFYPPIFHATPPLAALSPGGSACEASSAGEEQLLTPSTQAKWFSRTMTLKKQASALAQELKKHEHDAPSTHDGDHESPRKQVGRRQRLVRSEWEWIACGSEFGHLLFWHTGLSDSDSDAISIDAHDSAVVSIATSQTSELLVSLDASHRVHLWTLQPVLALRHLLDLRDKPSCFVLSARSELLLAGFDDGRVSITDASDLAHVETFPFPFRSDAVLEADDHQHSAMVSAGDFLDEKRVVLTVSVDAIVKVWDQRRTLLRQVAISSALTSLCFMNSHGDVMAGLPAGIFVLSRHDVLPEKLMKHGSSQKKKKKKKRPHQVEFQPETVANPSIAVIASSSTPNEPPVKPSTHSEQKSMATPKSSRSHNAQSPPSLDAFFSRINDRPLAASRLHAPVLRPLQSPRIGLHEVSLPPMKVDADRPVRCVFVCLCGDVDAQEFDEVY